MLFLNFETSMTLPETSATMSDYIESLSTSHLIQHPTKNPYFDYYFTENDILRMQNNLDWIDGVRIMLNNSSSEQLIEELKPTGNSVVIFPIFTSIAYQNPGFYTYYAGNCDESCIIDLPLKLPVFDYSSSGVTAQILYSVGYDFLTDIQVDKNPELLKNYDTVILLHNEYVTKKEFNAISNHPNLIFLHPNALYAEIDVNYDDESITLIRGHQYPDSKIGNGFDYEIEEKFHEYEYDNECLKWEFIKITNGFHLNCYPESAVTANLDILLKLKEL
jgi:hypothetical protein